MTKGDEESWRGGARKRALHRLQVVTLNVEGAPGIWRLLDALQCSCRRKLVSRRRSGMLWIDGRHCWAITSTVWQGAPTEGDGQRNSSSHTQTKNYFTTDESQINLAMDQTSLGHTHLSGHCLSSFPQEQDQSTKFQRHELRGPTG